MHDSWFEEGTRLLYIVATNAVDSILPLDIHPAPAKVVRVFVGRVEIITPAIQNKIREAFAKGDLSTLAKYGRFLQRITDTIVAWDPPAPVKHVDLDDLTSLFELQI